MRVHMCACTYMCMCVCGVCVRTCQVVDSSGMMVRKERRERRGE